jgi:hypothetical protein
MLSNNAAQFDQRAIEDSAERACKAFDGFNCWLSMKLSQWDNLGKTIKRKDEIFSDKSMTLESLKSPVTIVPINEQNFVDQKDIEELDSNSIHIK